MGQAGQYRPSVVELELELPCYAAGRGLERKVIYDIIVWVCFVVLHFTRLHKHPQLPEPGTDQLLSP